MLRSPFSQKYLSFFVSYQLRQNVSKFGSCCYVNNRQIANLQANLLSKVRKRVKATKRKLSSLQRVNSQVIDSDFV